MQEIYFYQEVNIWVLYLLLLETYASNGQYQSAIWKYDSSGEIIEDFGTYIYTNGKIPGLKTLKINGSDKFQDFLRLIINF